MLKTYEWADPAISVRRYQRIAARFRLARDREYLRIFDRVGALQALADAGGPNTARVAEASIARIRRKMDRYEAEAASWASAAYRILELHANDEANSKGWATPLCHDPLGELA
jgi:hypothetical protein